MLDDVPGYVWDVISGFIGALVAVVFLAQPVALYPLGRFYFAFLGGFATGFLRYNDTRDSVKAGVYFVMVALLIMFVFLGWLDRVHTYGGVRTIDLLVVDRFPIPMYPFSFISVLIAGGFTGAILGGYISRKTRDKIEIPTR